MGGLKRKEAPTGSKQKEKKQRITEQTASKPQAPSSRSRLEEAARHEDGDDDNDFTGFPEGDGLVADRNTGKVGAHGKGGPQQFKLETTSAEAHAKQRQVAKERRAAKPNADAIQRSKQLWERLRRKSHVPKEERKELVAELFGIIDGRVREFVFKHDSVRVIQCAIKYARPEQLKSIVKELQCDVRDLVESRYGKFLVAKMVVQGDRGDQDLIVPQFYGHVKRLINHPEASWIVDDIYRQVATSHQKAMMLREWYGTEFALFAKQRPNASAEQASADLRKILEANPEKRKPILSYLKQMINNLVQKKMTGFTMLHDAMLQYFLTLQSGSEEHADFMEMLKGDIDADEEGGGGDLFRNLAFTSSGSRLVCLTLAYGSAKDRKIILKCFKDNIEIMALDQHAKMVLITGLDVPDDTKMTSQTILRELLGLQMEDLPQRFDRLEALITNLNSRVPILYVMAGAQKWLLNTSETALLADVHAIRSTSSKKAPQTRRQELLSHSSAPMLEFVAERAGNLVRSSFGSQAIAEILLECHDKDNEKRNAAKSAVARLAQGCPLEDEHIAKDAAAGRMLKTLVFGGNYDPETKHIKLAEPRLGFGQTLYPVITSYLVDWACSDSSFVIVALLESEDVPMDVKESVEAALRKGKKQIKQAAAANDTENGISSDAQVVADEKGTSRGKKPRKTKGNAGARILLGTL